MAHISVNCQRKCPSGRDASPSQVLTPKHSVTWANLGGVSREPCPPFPQIYLKNHCNQSSFKQYCAIRVVLWVLGELAVLPKFFGCLYLFFWICPCVSLPQQFTGTHLYSWVERGTVTVKCLAQEHNTVTPADQASNPDCPIKGSSMLTRARH